MISPGSLAPATISLAPASVSYSQSSTAVSTTNSKHITNDVEKKFKINCWNSFQKFSLGNEGLPVRKLNIALQHISNLASPLQVSALTKQLGVNVLDMINWQEYQELAYVLFTPILGLTSQPNPSAPVHPYQSLLRRQRAASSIYFIPSNQSCAEQPATVKQLDGLRVPTSVISSAVVEDMRKSRREVRRESATAGAISPSNSGDNWNFTQLTQQQRIKQVLHPKESYSVKWEAMKEKRDARRQGVDSRASRKAINRNISSISAAATRNIVADKLNDRITMDDAAVESNYNKRKQEGAVVQRHIDSFKDEEHNRRSNFANTLKQSLCASTILSKSMLLEESYDKSAYKASSIERLSAHSSTMIDIPQKFYDNITRARSQKQFDAAQKALQQYKEQVLSGRISEYVKAKNDAKIHIVLRSPLMQMKKNQLTASNSPMRDQEYFTASTEGDEDFMLNIEFAKYLGDSYSLPPLSTNDSFDQENDFQA